MVALGVASFKLASGVIESRPVDKHWRKHPLAVPRLGTASSVDHHADRHSVDAWWDGRPSHVSRPPLSPIDLDVYSVETITEHNLGFLEVSLMAVLGG